MSTLLQTPEQAAAWLRARVSGSLFTDSRSVGHGDGFIAWPGAARDGRAFVENVLARGAAACLVEQAGADAFAFDDHRVAIYPELKAAAGPIAAAYFGQPSYKLKVVAVTGTNGKTSSTWWLAEALAKLGQRCALVGTLGIGEPGALSFNGLTTPDPVLLQQQLGQFADGGYTACAIEASSIGIAERRLDATQIEVAVFTNFTQDHLDYHGSMQAYWEAKKSLFAWHGLKAAVINVDDPQGAMLAAELEGRGLDVWTVSVFGPARLYATAIVQEGATLSFEVAESTPRHRLSVGAAGLYNVSNLLGVIATLRALGHTLRDAATACTGLSSVPGRLDIVAADPSAHLPLVVVDYAHTPDALDKVLTALKPVALGRGGQLWCVFGCGGDRDAGKRPLMAAAAQAHADHLMVTSDNPRNEAPDAIIGQIVSGLSMSDSVQVEPDRALAISRAIDQAAPADVVLLAGKGHEEYQEVLGVKQRFSDREHAQSSLARRSATGIHEGTPA